MLVHGVARTIRQFRMIRPGDRVVVAVSGGPDSVGLTEVLFELRTKPEPGPFEMILAHLNHQLRPDSDEDEALCGALARRLGVRFISERIDVAGEARRQRCSLEEAGRWARYGFLEAARHRFHAARIALGHTQDDQAETVLLHLLRGAGATGLAAMRPVVGETIIRPLLETRRRDVVRFLAERKIAYRLDSSNEDCSFLRNRIRHRALPLLEREFNSGLVETLTRTATLLRDEEEWMEEESDRALKEIACRQPEHGLCVSARGLAGLHPALARRVIRRAIRIAKGDLRSLTSRHVEAILRLSGPGKSGRRLSLPRLSSGRSFDHIWVRPADRSRDDTRACERDVVAPEHSAEDGYNGYEYVLPVPGRLEVPEAGGVLQVVESGVGTLPCAAGESVVVGVSGVGEEGYRLKVRSPRAGDRFHPLGARGSKSLSRYLMARRVERDRRRRVPLVVGADDQVLWVVGHGVSEESRVGPGTRRLNLIWVEG